MSDGDSVLGLLWFPLIIGLSICSCYCRYYRRKQAEERFLRRVQMAAAQVQPLIIYQIQPIAVPTFRRVNTSILRTNRFCQTE